MLHDKPLLLSIGQISSLKRFEYCSSWVLINICKVATNSALFLYPTPQTVVSTFVFKVLCSSRSSSRCLKFDISHLLLLDLLSLYKGGISVRFSGLALGGVVSSELRYCSSLEKGIRSGMHSVKAGQNTLYSWWNPRFDLMLPPSGNFVTIL